MPLSKDHKAKIAASLSKDSPELVARIRELRDQLPLRKLAKEVGIGYATLSRIIKKHKIKLSKDGLQRATDSSRQANLGKTPWNKGGTLTEETKQKISESVSGERNGQFGRGMTEAEKHRWRESYFTEGIIKMRAWLESEPGQAAQNKSKVATTTDEFREACSERAIDLVRRGKIKFRGKPTKMNTKKGGKFTTKSSYETRYAEMLEADPQVKRFIYEPFKIPYKVRGKKKNYIPDFLVEYVDGREELVEVKPAKLVDLPRNKAKIKAGMAHRLDFVIM